MKATTRRTLRNDSAWILMRLTVDARIWSMPAESAEYAIRGEATGFINLNNPRTNCRPRYPEVRAVVAYHSRTGVTYSSGVKTVTRLTGVNWGNFPSRCTIFLCIYFMNKVRGTDWQKHFWCPHPNSSMLMYKMLYVALIIYLLYTLYLIYIWENCRFVIFLFVGCMETNGSIVIRKIY